MQKPKWKHRPRVLGGHNGARVVVELMVRGPSGQHNPPPCPSQGRRMKEELESLRAENIALKENLKRVQQDL